MAKNDAAPQIEVRRADSLSPHPKNSRTHSAAQVDLLCKLLLEYGWTRPVLADEGAVILAGHGIVQAALRLAQEGAKVPRWADPATVPVLVVPGLSEAQKRAYVIADNKSAERAGWDFGMLASELADLKGMGFDLALTGLDAIEINDLLSVREDRNPDAAPALPEKAVSLPGDLWVLGPHKLLVGDATKPEHYARLLDGAKVDTVWTDPPYNVDYKDGAIQGDKQTDQAFERFLVDAAAAMHGAMKQGASIYIAHADTEGLAFRTAFRAAGFHLSGCVIWDKDTLVLGRSDYQWKHEPILYGWRPGSKHRWFGGRKQTTVQRLEHSAFVQQPDGTWAVTLGDEVFVVDGKAAVHSVVPSVIKHERPKSSAEHPTMKPVGLIERMLKNSARPNDLVLDPFGGSGSTLIAADRLGMIAALIEIDERFADVIVLRYQEYTGRKALLDGKTFESVAAARGVKPTKGRKKP